MQITTFNVVTSLISFVLAVMVLVLWRRQRIIGLVSPVQKENNGIETPVVVREARIEYRRTYRRALFFGISTVGFWSVTLVMLHAGGLIAPTHGKLSQILVSSASGMGMIFASLNLRGWWKSYESAASKLRLLLKRWDAGVIVDVELFKSLFDAILVAHGSLFEKALEDMSLATSTQQPAAVAAPTSVVATTTNTTTTVAAAGVAAPSAKPAKT